MILPTKHIPLDQSLLGIGAYLLQQLNQPRTVTSLWEETREHPALGSFERFSLALVMLFSLGAIDLHAGLLRRQRP
jgi:hypothetical protein